MKRGWWRDTLFLRLFVLMWAALVLSHAAAFGLVTSGWLSFLGGEHGADARPPRPTFPSLPPWNAGPGPGGEADPGGGPGGPPEPLGPPRGPRGGLSMPLLVIDYLVRVVVIGIAAAIGARWLTEPVRRLVDAARELGPRVAGGRAPTPLDESAGTVEVREAAQVFNRMARELEQQWRNRELMMAALSHDLKTPLTRIRMRLETAEPDAAEPARDAQTLLRVRERTVADVREMTSLIDGTLDTFRAAAVAEPVGRVELHALLQAIVDDALESGARIRLEGSAAIALARPGSVRRVVGNLLGNALRHGGGKADLGLAREGAEVVVRIVNGGPGIPEPLLERVFEPFFRVDPSRSRQTGGTGLGLHIARDLARRDGGDVRLFNRPGGGLEARLTLPAAPA